jgi:hypothetical protein
MTQKPEYYRRFIYKTKYGITVDEYEMLLAKQGGVCALCHQACTTGKRLAVDHDHITSRIRGLLCFHCNTAIGKLGDSPFTLAAALGYLYHEEGMITTVEVSNYEL